MFLLRSQASEIARRASRCSATASRASTSKRQPSRSIRDCAWRSPLRAPPASEKPVERHARLLAELAQLEAEVEVDRQVLGADLVERGEPAVLVGQLAELPGELAADVGRADRIAHRDPAAAADAVHQEARARLVEEQPLVADQREVRLRAGRRRDQLLGALEIRRTRAARAGGGAGRSSRASANAASARPPPDERAQRARRVAVELELPPEVVGVLDVSIGEQHDEACADQHQRDAGHPARRERLREQRAAPIEVLRQGASATAIAASTSASSQSRPFASEATQPPTSSASVST